MSSEVDILKRRLERERLARKEAERILEERSLQLYHANEKLIEINQNLEEKVEKRSKELFIQEKNYQQVVENVPDIIYKADADGKFIFVNKNAEEITGYSEKELLQMHYMQLIKGDHVENVQAFYYQQYLEKVSKSYLEFPILTKEQKLVWIGQNVQYNYKNNGEIEEVFAIARDITEFKYANEQLAISEEKYRSIIENLHLGLLETDVEGIVTKVYPKFTELTGYAPQDLLNKDPKKVLLKNDADRQLVVEQEKLRIQKKASAYEAPLVKKNGETIWVIISAAPIFSREGEIIGTIGVHFDISERKQMEEDLRNARHEAESAQKAEQLFLANMSHEIRTPLNAVIGMAHLLYDLSSTQEQIEYLDIIKNSANLLKGIINDILDISKIEAGKLEYNESDFLIAELIKSLSKTFELKVQGKPIEVKSEIDDLLKNQVIKGDSLLLNQVLLNLLSNAEKFTSKGEIGLNAQVLNNTPDRIDLQFMVYDSGIGISPNRIDSIFEKYEQANQETKMKYGGTGLGLAITKKIVEFLGGHISVESTENIGSVFKVNLGFEKSADSAEAKIEVNTEKEQTKVYKDVLVVEDNAMNRKYLGEIFKRFDLSVEYAFDGQIAIEKTQQKVFDIILMDLQMPVKDGFEATVEIRNKLNPNHKTEIVGLSAFATDEVIKKCNMAGMNNFISKPVTPSQIIDLLNLRQQQPVIDSTGIDKRSRLDKNVLEELYFGDESYAFEMFDHFLGVADEQINQLKTTINEQNWKELRRLIHKMKPGFSMVGLPGLQEIGSKLETACELDAEKEILEISKTLFIEFDASIKDVEEEHKRLKESINSK
ncbi:MAG: PAS domain S-box protein [Bacteroidia bacterium]